jgi:hypothetical protein
MNIKSRIITGEVLESVRESLGLSLLDYCWILGIYNPTYTRLTTKGANEPLDHAHAALIRYLNAYFPEYPFDRVITQNSKDSTKILINQIRNSYEKVGPLKLGGEILDLNQYGSLGTMLFRSYSSARHYETGATEMTLTIARWSHLVVYCFENGLEKRIIKVINEEAKAHGIDPETLLPRGWYSPA